MKFRPRLLWTVAALAAGCGDSATPPSEGVVDSGQEPEDSGADTDMDASVGKDAAEPADDAGTGGEDAEVDAGPGSVYGLDSRPANTTCFAPKFGEEMPALLSQTGCFDEAEPGKPLEMLIPFDLNAALWSDAASKHRWLVLPEGGKIRIVEGGDFELPPGTMLIKEFRMGEHKLETRFFVHHPVEEGADAGNVATTWVGYAYRWNAEQTEATLEAPGTPAPLDVDGDGPSAETWQIPTRVECMTCHNAAPGFSLGLEVGQLNRDFTYPATGRTANQLLTLEHIGAFEEPLAGPPATLLRLPPYASGDATIDQKARSYLHANCSHCHRTGSIRDGAAPDDFRATIPLAEMHVCNEPPTNPSAVSALFGEADAGTADAGTPYLLAPGQADHSMLWLRMNSRGSWQMPPIATKKVDELGRNLLETWINNTITECPE